MTSHLVMVATTSEMGNRWQIRLDVIDLDDLSGLRTDIGDAEIVCSFRLSTLYWGYPTA
jgi:hypothetical protein